MLDTTSSAGQRYDITNMLPHPNYAYNNDTLGSANDIAVITLQQTVTSVSPVPTLPGTLFDSVLTTGTPVTIEGYGTHDSTNTTGQLYVASTPFQQRTKAEFLAGGSGSPDTCLGDSGGPVYVTAGGTMYTAGITSRQSDGSNCASASVYEVLNAFDTFLTANSKGAYPPTYPADGVPGSGTALAGCSCRVNNAPASSGLGLWMGFGVARIARRRRRA